MSNIEITELGRKWFGVSVSFDDVEIDRVSPEVLRGFGGKLRYDNDGGLRALFHFNVTNKDNSDKLLQVLKYFGVDGYFHRGVDLVATPDTIISESNDSMLSVIDRAVKSYHSWAYQWTDIVDTAIILKLSRIEILRKVSDLGMTHINETHIREYIESVLRNKYDSDMFVETFMWRLGWPDKRKPFAQVIDTTHLNSVG